jgi:hypothetical protein
VCVFLIGCDLETSAMRRPRSGFGSCIWVRIPAATSMFSLVRKFQTLFGAHPASYSIGTSVLFPGMKRPGHEAVRSPTSSAKVKNEWKYKSSNLCLYAVYRNGFSFLLQLNKQLQPSNLDFLKRRFPLANAISAITRLGN